MEKAKGIDEKMKDKLAQDDLTGSLFILFTIIIVVLFLLLFPPSGHQAASSASVPEFNLGGILIIVAAFVFVMIRREK
ncbi:MAG: hypothetical protein WC900_04555 [Oscillospiraceae bacterium]|jgi:hypothetical protein